MTDITSTNNDQVSSASAKKAGSLRARRLTGNIVSHTFLTVMAVLWVVPVVWIIMESFNKQTGPYMSTFFPTEYTLDNYVQLFTNSSVIDFPAMFMRTLIVSICVCVIQLFFVLSVGFVMSRLRFKFRRPFMNSALILGMFPGIMAALALYFMAKAMGLTETTGGVMIALVLVYSAGSGATFYIMKGFMDTIPMSLDEAAMLDGCTRWQIFTRIILPITKPMMVYQAIVGFLVPWLDFVAARVIARTQDRYTVPVGMWQMLQREYITQWFARFAAGAVVVSIPIAILFIVMQRFYQSSMSGAVKG
ncbi:MAG: ABC transporter permease subunit [Propionibacteriaceae bacterium]|nr:ABC transporter permease subunit [Propionibacteriaceae bacterium]